MSDDCWPHVHLSENSDHSIRIEVTFGPHTVLQPLSTFKTTTDAVFSKYLENITSRTFVTYFSYHRPIVTFVCIDCFYI